MKLSRINAIALGAACGSAAIMGCSQPTIVCPEGAKPVQAPSANVDRFPDAWVLACVRPDGTQHGYSFGYVGDQLMNVGHYVDGKLDGSAVTWHASGRRWHVRDFDAGVPTGTTMEWNEAGIKVWEVVHGAPGESSISTAWYDDGSLKYRAVLVGDHLHGNYERYYPNGQLQQRGHYVRDRRHGTWTCWNESGQSRVEVVRDHGKEMSRMGDTDNSQAMEACRGGCSDNDATVAQACGKGSSPAAPEHSS